MHLPRESETLAKGAPVHESHVALYDFATTDATKLPFAKDDVISVYRKAQNGWWYGSIDARRGWFPSNFVTPLEEYIKTPIGHQLDTQSETESRDYYTHHLTGEERSSLGSPVVSDFSSSYSIPSEGSIIIPARRESHSLSASAFFQQQQYSLITETLPAHWKRIQASDGKVMFFNSETKALQWMHPELEVNSGKYRKIVIPYSVRKLLEELPLNWGKKTDSDGKVYYYNYRTDQTVWNLEDIDFRTGELNIPSTLVESISIKLQSIVPLNYGTSELWRALTEGAIKSIELLDSLVVLNQKEKFIPQSAIVVENIRVLLLASLTPSGSPQHMEAQGTVKDAHRVIMTALSRLVFNVKTACMMWPGPDSLHSIQASELAVIDAVRNFVSAAITAGVIVDVEELKRAKAGIQKVDYSVLPTNAEIISKLGQFLVVICGRTSTIIDSMRMNPFEKSRDVVLADIGRVITITGSFLSVVEEQLSFESSSNELLMEFSQCRYAVQMSVKELLEVVSVAEGTYTPPTIVQEIAIAILTVKDTASDLLIAVKFLVNDHEVYQANRSSTPLVAPDNSSSTQSISTTSRTSNELSSASPVPQSRLSLPTSRVTAPTISSLLARRHTNNEPSSPIPSLSLNLSLLGSSVKDTPGSPRTSQFTGSLARAARNLGIDSILAKRPFESSRRQSDSSKVEKPWYLQHDYDDRDMLYNMDSTIKGGTLEALVEKLTSHDGNDVTFVQSFLLTYRSFCTTAVLFEQLKKRFSIVAPAGLSAEELSDWESHKKHFIQIRVLNVLKLWLETYFYENDEDRAVLVHVKLFAEGDMMTTAPSLAQQLLQSIERRESHGEKSFTRSQSSLKENPPSLLPKSLRSFALIDLEAKEVARQLTLLESQNYIQIQTVECLKKAWSKKDGNERAPNVKAMINTSNRIAGWIIRTILSEIDLKRRVNIVKHFIGVAEACRSLNNFCTLNTILGALASSSIYRLKRTWELVGKKTLEKMESLKQLMTREKNFSRYRATLKTTSAPCIPYLGLFLTDLTFIEDGCTDYVKSSIDDDDVGAQPRELINFYKWMKTAEVIRDIQQFRNVPFNLTRVNEIQQFLTEGLEQGELDEEVCFQLSLELEPREREDL
ncbi:ras guanine nucleotide exchange factor domain-containing protein [Obelidium mucronatum]|nr:ras guanine nucleotide exchange factor domain-containing protein [Obelidium mucronatum]